VCAINHGTKAVVKGVGVGVVVVGGGVRCTS